MLLYTSTPQHFRDKYCTFTLLHVFNGYSHQLLPPPGGAIIRTFKLNMQLTLRIFMVFIGDYFSVTLPMFSVIIEDVQHRIKLKNHFARQNLMCTFHVQSMINQHALWSASEVSSFVDQSFFQGLLPIDEDHRPGTEENAVYVTIALGQLGTETQKNRSTGTETGDYSVQSSATVMTYYGQVYISR